MGAPPGWPGGALEARQSLSSPSPRQCNKANASWQLVHSSAYGDAQWAVRPANRMVRFVLTWKRAKLDPLPAIEGRRRCLRYVRHFSPHGRKARRFTRGPGETIVSTLSAEPGVQPSTSCPSPLRPLRCSISSNRTCRGRPTVILELTGSDAQLLDWPGPRGPNPDQLQSWSLPSNLRPFGYERVLCLRQLLSEIQKLLAVHELPRPREHFFLFLSRMVLHQVLQDLGLGPELL